ncbi:MAG: tetratricopeptide repeat protein [Acidobacteriota bacterium]
MVHRDLKPANVQLLPSGVVKVLDFGLAHVWRGPGAEQEVGLAGTPAYMSPEQASCESLDGRSDLFSLGVVLSECLTARQTPVDDRTEARFARGQQAEVDWSQLEDAPPSGLRRVIDACLQVDRENRPATAAEVGQALRVELSRIEREEEAEIVRRRHFLPTESGSFVGRDAELEELVARLQGEARLVTLHGPGGIGKTRLVLRHAWSRLETYPGGAWFCDLSEARDLDGLLSSVVRALDVPLGGGDVIEQLGHAIAGRGDCLIVLDNFEQVAEHARATVGSWLQRAEEARFVVTSRVLLDLPAQDVLHLKPLELEGAATELFGRRARARKQGFVITDENREHVHEVVRLLDGLPLAIELAAARISVLTPRRIVERMTDRFQLLAGASASTDRQATLKAAIDWSWDLLEPWARAALAQLSVFEGGFTLEAAEAVLDLSAWKEAPWPLDTVQVLVDQSLLNTWTPQQVGTTDASDEPHFSLLVSIRDYASEKLRTEGAVPDGESGDEAERSALVRHGEHFARFGADDAIESLSVHGGVERRRVLGRALENLVSACRRAVARGDAATAVATLVATWEVLQLSGPAELGRALGSEVLALDGLTDGERARVLFVSGSAQHQLGRPEAETSLEQALLLARGEDDRRLEASVLDRMASLSSHRGDLDSAVQQHEQALVTAVETGWRRFEGVVLGNLGNARRREGLVESARELQERALTIHRELGDRRHEGASLGQLAIVAWQLGRVGEARTLFEQALSIHREVGDRAGEGDVLCNLGSLCRDEGHHEVGREFYEESLAIHREVGRRKQEGIVLGHLGIVHDLDGRVDEALACYEAGLSIYREVDDRRNEGHVLANLGSLHADRGQVAEAQALHEQALALHREVGDRLGEGIALANLGSVQAEQGRFDEAWPAFDAGESLLRELQHPLQLGLLLAARGHAALASGDESAARARLAEAEELASQVGAGADSELGRRLAVLRSSLDGGR